MSVLAEAGMKPGLEQPQRQNLLLRAWQSYENLLGGFVAQLAHGFGSFGALTYTYTA